MDRNKLQALPIDVFDRLFTVQETRAVLRVGNTKLYDMVKKGTLDVVRLGRRTTRVKGSSIAALVAGGV